ncbi:hypothetical protein V500_00171 [Pseudogymnoascus sp. VKM F-4518 (FW-2643)]|nr:hypothetical protein V500_00171 [Pseudogymnoascus sp. VKM F-4518 (FW-2643)]
MSVAADPQLGDPPDADGRFCDQLLSIPVPPTMPVERETECCCGRDSCAYLRHNNEALDGLEKDVRTAAQLGQALLVRHEAYIVEAEESRRQMSLRIDSLKTDKRNLEAENARTVQENRDLLSHLEQLNGAIADSESRAGNLEATLQGTLLEMKRLDSLASRTHDLEAQLAELEKEQDDLRETVVLTEAESRTAVRRWREAERRLGEVQDQLERIEREASEEKARHEEVFRRMERQKLVDKAIQDTSNGKVAVLNAGQGKEGTNVVSHFVKDILQDNVNLQMGIVELRDMLTTSNDEVQKLRDQLMAHQPVRDGGENTVPVTLAAELTVKEPLSLSQELHVHHHYHAPAKKDETRRAVPKRKRNVSITTPTRLNGRGHSTRQSQSSIAATILSQTSSTVPSPRTANRWSTQSEFASTEPSSPTSNYRNSFLFDRMSVDQNTDYSRPTSPGSSNDPLSPSVKPMHRRRQSDFSMHSFKAQMFETSTIHEEEDYDVSHIPELEERPKSRRISQDDSNFDLNSGQASNGFDPYASHHSSHKLRRSTSHESIISVSGIDIHTLKSRPSQLTISGSRALLRTPSRQVSSVSTSFVSTEPILSPAETTRPTLSKQNYSSSSLLRSSIGIAERPSSLKSTASGDEATTSVQKLGGWIFGRWGMSPSSNTSSPAASIVDVPPPSLRIGTDGTPTTPAADPNRDPLRMFMGRSPGINQVGPIPGFRKIEKAPSRVIPERVDWESLLEHRRAMALPAAFPGLPTTAARRPTGQLRRELTITGEDTGFPNECCLDTEFCFVDKDFKSKCCAIGNDCASVNICTDTTLFYCHTTSTITAATTSSTRRVSSRSSTTPSSITSTHNPSITVLPACCPLACPASTEYKCPSSLGGKCCSLGATCVSNGCVATLPPTTSTTSSSIPSCATSNIPCTDGLGGCCNSGAHCTTVQSTGYCASGSAAPTELRIGGKTGDEIVEKPRGGGGLSSGAKAGIGAGVAIGALLVIGAAVWWWISRRRQAGGSAPRGSGRGSGPWGSARGGTETVVSMQQGSTPGGPDMAGRGTEDYFGPAAGIGPFTGAEGAGMARSGAVPVSPDQPGDIQPAVEIGEALGRPTPVSPRPSTRHEYWKHGAKTVGERVELE